VRLRPFILAQMKSHAEQFPRQGPRSPFLIWGWAMLLVVLLSAAPTGGPVRSRLVGSAFDPATFSVALGPKQPKSKALAKAVVGRLPAGLADGPLPGAVAAVVPGAPLLARTEHAPAPEPLAADRVRTGLSPKAHGARAPPLG
jgi:hypothetical protein